MGFPANPPNLQLAGGTNEKLYLDKGRGKINMKMIVAWIAWHETL